MASSSMGAVTFQNRIYLSDIQKSKVKMKIHTDFLVVIIFFSTNSVQGDRNQFQIEVRVGGGGGGEGRDN